MQPLIGVIAAVENGDRSFVWHNYVRSIEAAGADVIVLPHTESPERIDRFADLCDGFLLTGGVDLSPARYGEAQKDTCGAVDLQRDAFDFLVFPRLLATGKPMLGICRGSQLINVALGGSLYQDIPTEIPSELVHRQGQPHSAPAHPVRILPDTPLAELFGACEIPVNSLHHQAVKRFGAGLVPMAFAPDGVVEAFYLPTHGFLWGIQWHPERSQETDANSRAIFAALVNSCRAERGKGVLDQ